MGDLIAWTISKGWNHRKTHCYKGYQTSNIKLIKPWPSCLNSSHPHWRRPKLQRHEVITRSFGSSMLSIGIGSNLHRKPMFFTIKYRGFLWKKHIIQSNLVMFFRKGSGCENWSFDWSLAQPSVDMQRLSHRLYQQGLYQSSTSYQLVIQECLGIKSNWNHKLNLNRNWIPSKCWMFF